MVKSYREIRTVSKYVTPIGVVQCKLIIGNPLPQPASRFSILAAKASCKSFESSIAAFRYDVICSIGDRMIAGVK
jgi:hypothetical protein